MNKLDLSTLGVEEMSDVQMQEVDGGWLRELACADIAFKASLVAAFMQGYCDYKM
jgi:hypothetical protein